MCKNIIKQIKSIINKRGSMSRTNNKPSVLWLQNFIEFTDFEIDPIVSFINETSHMINEKQSEIDNKFQEWERMHENDPDMPSAFDVFENEIFEHERFSTILLQSTFITIYSKLENTFFDICEFCRKNFEHSIDVKDLAGRNYIQRFKKYLKLVIGINLSSIETDWNDIIKYQRIRNTFVHKGGEIKNIESDLETFINNTDGISYDLSTKKIVLESIKFNIDFCNIVKQFISINITEIINQKS